jgi:hypothetical protein
VSNSAPAAWRRMCRYGGAAASWSLQAAAGGSNLSLTDAKADAAGSGVKQEMDRAGQVFIDANLNQARSGRARGGRRVQGRARWGGGRPRERVAPAAGAYFGSGAAGGAGACFGPGAGAAGATGACGGTVVLVPGRCWCRYWRLVMVVLLLELPVLRGDSSVRDA